MHRTYNACLSPDDHYQLRDEVIVGFRARGFEQKPVRCAQLHVHHNHPLCVSDNALQCRIVRGITLVGNEYLEVYPLYMGFSSLDVVNYSEHGTFLAREERSLERDSLVKHVVALLADSSTMNDVLAISAAVCK